MADLPRCRTCNKRFSCFPTGTADHFPLLLRCGHTFCKRCITKCATGKKKAIVCQICEVETPCPYGKESVLKLWPNVYMAGVMSCGSELPSLAHYFANSDHVASMKKPNERKRIGHKCSECVSVPASCRCVQCLADMCEKCFVTVHSHSRLLQQHQSVPLRSSLINTECDTHHRLLEFFCEDDKTPICPECMICPEHRNHNIVQTVKKYEGMEQELKFAQSEAYCALQYCSVVKSQLAGQIHKIKTAAYQQAERIHQHILDYIGVIQAQFLGLTKELHDSAELCSGELVGLMEEIERKELMVREACDDTDLVLSNETKTQVVVNPEKLLETLRISKTLPYKLLARKEAIDNNNNAEYKAVGTEDVEFDFTLMPGLPAFIHKFGEIEIRGELEYKLLLVSENPDLMVARPAQKESDEAEKKPGTVRQIQEPPTRSQELVHVTFMQNPSNFRVQRWADKSHIEAIERCLKAYKTRKPLLEDTMTTVAIGELCAAFYEPTRCWYRASVVRKIEDESELAKMMNECEEMASPENDCTNLKPAVAQDVVEILFIDYGNLGRTTVSCLRRLPENLKTVPELSILCMMNNICPPNVQQGWSSQTINYFSKVINNRPLLMTTARREKGYRIVDLHRPAADEIDADVPVSIRDALVFLGLARLSVTLPSLGPTQAATKKFLTPSPIPVNSLVSVSVSYLHGPDRFMVQQTDSNIKYLEQLMASIQIWVRKQLTGKDSATFKDGVHYLQMICPKEGMVCIAEYPCDRQWYRAKIIGVNEDRTVKVEYVDYGDWATVYFSQLLKIPEIFTRLPVQALPCQLQGVSTLPGDDIFSSICQKRFAELCSNSELIMEVRALSNSIYLVDLFDSMDEDPSLVSVADRLYREGHVRLEKREAKITSETAENSGAAEDKQQESNTGKEKPTPESAEEQKDTKLNARVTRVISPDLFYVQTDHQMSELNKMMLELQQDVEQDSEELCETDPGTWQEGSLCVVRSKMEKRWCRAKIESLDSKAETCKVVLTDFGWLEQYPLSHILKLPEKFAEICEYLTKCTLGSVRPAGGSDKWALVTADRFKELVSGQECLIEICKNDEVHSDALPVDIWTSDNGQEGVNLTTENCMKISTILTMEGLALPFRCRRKSSNVKPVNSNAEGGVSTVRDSKSTYNSDETETANQSESAVDDEQERVPDQATEDETSPPPVMEQTEDVSAEVQDAEEKEELIVAEPAMASVTDVDNDIAMVEQEIAESTPLSYTQFNHLETGKRFPCCVTHIHNSKTIYLKLRPDIQDKYNDAILDEMFQWNMMMHQVQEVERSYLALLTEDDLVVGRPCLCQYVFDNRWHRAIILSIEPLPKAVLIQYVDFGTLDFAPLTRLRQIPPAVCEIPVQAYLCEPADAEDSDEKVTEMAEQFSSKNLVAEIKGKIDPPPEKAHFKVMYKIEIFHVDGDGYTHNVMH